MVFPEVKIFSSFTKKTRVSEVINQKVRQRMQVFRSEVRDRKNCGSVRGCSSRRNRMKHLKASAATVKKRWIEAQGTWLAPVLLLSLSISMCLENFKTKSWEKIIFKYRHTTFLRNTNLLISEPRNGGVKSGIGKIFTIYMFLYCLTFLQCSLFF